jgi:membrane protein involved in colicin uptake
MFPRSTRRVLQQQPPRHSDPQQQQAGSSDFQPKPQGKQQQMGEGSYEGSADYKQRTEEYLKKADVEADALAAKPRSAEEARELERAEEEAKSHSKGER